MKKILKSTLAIVAVFAAFTSCNNSGKSGGKSGALSSNIAEKVYVAPGEHDSHYAFISGGYSGNLTVYGLRRNDNNLRENFLVETFFLDPVLMHSPDQVFAEKPDPIFLQKPYRVFLGKPT